MLYVPAVLRCTLYNTMQLIIKTLADKALPITKTMFIGTPCIILLFLPPACTG